MSSLIRGYGLPSEGAGMYNGLGAYRAYGRSNRGVLQNRQLFATLPDPELGDFRGFGDDLTTLRKPTDHTVMVGGTAYTIGPAATGAGVGVGVLAVAALAAFFFLR